MRIMAKALADQLTPLILRIHCYFPYYDSTIVKPTLGTFSTFG